MLLLVNNVVQKMRMQVTNTISLYKLTNALLLLKVVMESMKVLIFLKFIYIFRKIFFWNVKNLKLT